ncbi:hypothetical protein CHS0354_040347 [Potamilus streckersoni]|uniref:RING-type domain-containing protein n=1 Tax=Potamilus streckersoni TaxID=2493646 RepID=A0AAE0S1I5_9BIVA|nr:hypothetical protein CHS0354_040347 [Potamilus streckersoni]
MKALCCICQEFFVNGDTINVSAISCGHIFHDTCLNEWLLTANTCPSCRCQVNKRGIVPKLFFDGGDDIDPAEFDSDKLRNEVDNLKLKIREKDKEKGEVIESKNLLSCRMKEMEKAKSQVERLLREEQSMNSSLKKQLEYFQCQQKSIEMEKEECKRIKKKLIELQGVETLLSGCESDAQEIIAQSGEGEGAITLLSQQCALIKREYERVKLEKKTLKDELDKCRKEVLLKSKTLYDQTKKLEILQEQLLRSEEDLKTVEKEKEVLKRKLSHLKKAIASPSAAASSSFIETLMEPSPNNSMNSTPIRLSKPDKNDSLIDLASPDIVQPTPPEVKIKRECEQNEIKYVKISSASEQNPAKKVRRDIQDISNFTSTLGSMNIFKKKSSDYSSVIRQGYNGLGGHESFTQIQKVPKPLFKKPRSRSKGLSKLASTKTPLLPTLDEFITLD